MIKGRLSRIWAHGRRWCWRGRAAFGHIALFGGAIPADKAASGLRHDRAEAGGAFVFERPAPVPALWAWVLFQLREKLLPDLAPIVTPRFAKLHGPGKDKIVKAAKLTHDAPPPTVGDYITQIVPSREDCGMQDIPRRQFIRSPNREGDGLIRHIRG